MDEDDGPFGSFMGMPGGASRMFGGGMPGGMPGGLPGGMPGAALAKLSQAHMHGSRCVSMNMDALRSRCWAER